jgi:hypothetical protein
MNSVSQEDVKFVVEKIFVCLQLMHQKNASTLFVITALHDHSKHIQTILAKCKSLKNQFFYPNLCSCHTFILKIQLQSSS